MNMTAKFISFRKMIQPAFIGRLNTEINTTARKVTTDAKRIATGRPGPIVQTGNLRRSIHAIFSTPATLLAAVVAPMPYAIFVEFGTMRSAAYPFMQPATEKNRADHLKRMKKAAWGRGLF